MKTAMKTFSSMALCCAVGGAAAAQPPDASSPVPPTAQSEAGEPRAATASPPAEAQPAARKGKQDQKPASRTDRLELGTATVTGEREQPKVMYIVPWKRSEIGELGKPMNSLVDEVLAPVDRDVFRREVTYYHAMQADTSQNGASPKPAPQGEK